jgi:APA family basic amino acid/polyamine antiporter
MFLCAKSASAAAAAVGFAANALQAVPDGPLRLEVPLAAAASLLITALVVSGLRRSNRVNACIVAVTVLALAGFIAFGLPAAAANAGTNLRPFFPEAGGNHLRDFGRATALVFVAYTGYGRIATLGEEVRDPRRSIPAAIVLTLAASMLLYLGVATVGVAGVGARAFAGAAGGGAAPLVGLSRSFRPGLAPLVAVGAIAAMLGVLLNLVLGLSRVVLAMARRGDLPRALARLSADRTSPGRAVVAVGVVVTALVLLGSIRLAWTFSAFTVLLYYAITNLAALRLPADQRLYPRAVSAVGLAGCLAAAVWVDFPVLASGLAVLAAGLAWHLAARRLRDGRGDLAAPSS